MNDSLVLEKDEKRTRNGAGISSQDGKPPVSGRIGSAITKMRDEIRLLVRDPEQGDPPPTEAVVSRTESLLVDTLRVLTIPDLPYGYVTSDGSAGIRIEWWQERTSCVHLVIGTEKDYVFCKFGSEDNGALSKNATPRELANQLNRLAAFHEETVE